MQRSRRSGGLHHRAPDHHAVADELPQRNQKLAAGDNSRLLAAATVCSTRSLEPRLVRGRLVRRQSQAAGSWYWPVAGCRLGDALRVCAEPSARCRRQPGIGGHMASLLKGGRSTPAEARQRPPGRSRSPANAAPGGPRRPRARAGIPLDSTDLSCCRVSSSRSSSRRSCLQARGQGNAHAVVSSPVAGAVPRSGRSTRGTARQHPLIRCRARSASATRVLRSRQSRAVLLRARCRTMEQTRGPKLVGQHVSRGFAIIRSSSPSPPAEANTEAASTTGTQCPPAPARVAAKAVQAPLEAMTGRVLPVRAAPLPALRRGPGAPRTPLPLNAWTSSPLQGDSGYQPGRTDSSRETKTAAKRTKCG